MTRRTKRLIAVLGVVLWVVMAILPLACARQNKTETFADYYFSFDYPAGYEVDERGDSEGKENSYSSGSILLSKATPANSDFYYALRWGVTQEPEISQHESALQAALELSRSYLEQSYETTGGFMQFSEIVEDSCSAHKMLRCYYKVVWSGGETVNGEIGQVCCSESRRSFTLCTRSSQKENEAEALAFLRVFTSSFVCH